MCTSPRTDFYPTSDAADSDSAIVFVHEFSIEPAIPAFDNVGAG